KLSEFNIVQESFVERLEAITSQKAENNKKTKRNHNNTLKEDTESGQIDSKMQLDSIISLNENNKISELCDRSMTLSLPNMDKENLQENQSNPEGDQIGQQMEIDNQLKPNRNKQDVVIKKKTYSAVVVRTKSEQQKIFENKRK
ncbi:8431_t:CDS:1, partial [Gigaspora margarita]